MHITVAVLLACLAVVPAQAAPPDAATIVAKMRAALEPDRPSVRRLVMRMSGVGGAMSEVSVGQARKRVKGVVRVVMVVLAPTALQGTTLLVEESGDANVQWLYVPAIGRVRKLVSPEAYTTFLNSDFTFADLGFVSMGAKYSLLGEEQREGVPAYKLEGVPRESWYYGRMLTWVATDSFLPIERHFFDTANRQWKVERWTQVASINGVPTARRITMEDVQANTKTEMEADGVRYDVDVPDDLFDAAQLPKAALSPLWAGLTSAASPGR